MSTRARHTEPDRGATFSEGIVAFLHIMAAAGCSVWFVVRLAEVLT
jgi:hypothetical protein